MPILPPPGSGTEVERPQPACMTSPQVTPFSPSAKVPTAIYPNIIGDPGCVAGAVTCQIDSKIPGVYRYTGNPDIRGMQTNRQFLRITGSGLRESHVHDVEIMREAPNYRGGM